MAAMLGEASEVPPNPDQLLGAFPAQTAAPPEVWVGSDQQKIPTCPHVPFEAKSETSGMSRTPSDGLP
jgi:hypothetical protein